MKWVVQLACLMMLCASGCTSKSEVETNSNPSRQAASSTLTDHQPGESEAERAAGQTETAGQVAGIVFPVFRDVAEDVGIDHVYRNGTSERQLMTEAMGGGAGWLDIDRDGLCDLFLPQAGETTPVDITVRGSDRLYRQSVGSQFQEVGEVAGTTCFEYGQGVASADVDNDGFPDLLVTNVGRNRLFLNNGDGTFSECNDVSMTEQESWSTSAAFGDVDLDGDVDLYVCNYADYDPNDPFECLGGDGKPIICHPSHLPPAADDFFLNNGDGSFTKCESDRGLVGPGNRALCVVMLDFDRDGAVDIYVGNDTTANFLFTNDGTGHFSDSALGMGAAVSAKGDSQASMGVGVGDFDLNGFQDLCVTHFTGEYNTLYQNNGTAGFRDLTSSSGLRTLTLSKLAFGVLMQDFNADGTEDLFFANGNIDPINPAGDGYEMYPQIVSYDGRRWHDGSKLAGLPFREKCVGRGLAAADFDNDGDTDIVLVRQNAKCRLLQNDSNPKNTLRLFLVGTTSNRDALGTYVTMDFGDAEIHQQALFCGESFAVANQLVVEFAVPVGATKRQCRVDWPNGQIQEFELSDAVRTAVLVEGQRQWSVPGNPVR